MLNLTFESITCCYMTIHPQTQWLNRNNVLLLYRQVSWRLGLTGVALLPGSLDQQDSFREYSSCNSGRGVRGQVKKCEVS